MKKITLYFVFLFLVYGVTAQYQPMLEVGNEWHTYHRAEFSDYFESKIFITKDTLIDEQRLFELSIVQCKDGNCDDGSYINPLYFREDTLTRHIYNYSIFTKKETLLYDFSLSPNDTFFINGNFPIVLDSISDYIKSPFACTDSGINLKLPNPKIFYFSTTSRSRVVWIEGIGTLTGFLGGDVDWGGINADATLLCHNKGTGQNIYAHNYCDIYSNPCQFTSTPLIFSTNRINFFPNPSSGQITLQIPENIRDFEIKVYNLQGQEVFFSVEKSLELSLLEKGIYVVTVFSNGQLLGSRKMVKE